MKTKLSIITVTYNSSKNIEGLIKSILNSTLPVFEFIVIENGSNDKIKTEEICKKYNKNLNIKYYLSKNVGFGKSCNAGFKKSSGNIVLFLNPDTELLSDSLDTLVRHSIKNNFDISGGRSETFDGSRHYTVVRKPNINIGLFEFSNLGKFFKTQKGHNDFYYLNDNKIIDATEDVKVDAVGGAYLLIKRRSFEKLNGFDENFFMYLEDVDLCVRANMLNMNVIYCPHSIIRHVGGASSDNKYKIRHQAWFDSRRYYYMKHFGLLANLIFQPLYLTEEILLKKYRQL